MTIKRKLFLGISLFVVAMVAISAIGFSLFMPPFVEMSKRNEMSQVGEQLKGILDVDALINEIPLVTEASDISIYITQNGNSIVYGPDISSNGRGRNMGGVGKMLQNLTPMDADGFYMTEHHILQSKQIVLPVILDSGLTAFIVRPYQSIEDVVEVSNTFFIMVGMVSIAFGLVFSWFYAKQFSKPIIKLNQMARQMAELDFTNKYSAGGNDEIGELGQSVNHLSDQLNKAMLELQLELTKKEELQLMQQRFLAESSHELKTPLAIILANLEEAVDQKMLEVDQSKHVDVMIKEIEHMDQIIKDLLKLSELENPEIKLQREKVDMASVFDDVLYAYSEMINEHNLNMVYDLHESMYCNCDAKNMAVAIRNIIGNAIKHTEYGKRIEISSKQNENGWHVRVFNESANLSDDELELIWTRFYKKGHTAASKTSSGLGLSIVKRVLELHEFEFGIQNEPGGIAFHLKWFEKS